MKRFAIFILLMLVVSTAWASDNGLHIPELAKGDILFCEEYPYRTVKNTSRTVYQIARLGFVKLATFQEAYGLRADGTIGPKTQQKAESEFYKKFNVKPKKYTDLNILNISVNQELTESNIAVTVTLRNESDDSLRIIGSIAFDSDGNFLFKYPALSLNKKYSIRKNEQIICASGPWKEIIICAGGTTIKSLKQVSVTASLPKLKPNESGLITIETGYIDSTLSTGTVNAMSVIPGSEEDNGIAIYFKPGKFDVSDKDLTALLNKLNESKKYRILGYSCKEDKGSDVEQLVAAERRAEAIENILIDNGFSQKNITTIAYDESSECKAVVIEIDEL